MVYFDYIYAAYVYGIKYKYCILDYYMLISVLNEDSSTGVHTPWTEPEVVAGSVVLLLLSSLFLWLMRKSFQRATDCEFRNIMVSSISPIAKVIQWSS